MSTCGCLRKVAGGNKYSCFCREDEFNHTKITHTKDELPTHLEPCGAPVDELDGALGLDGRDGGVDVLGHDITTVCKHKNKNQIPNSNQTESTKVNTFLLRPRILQITEKSPSR